MVSPVSVLCHSAMRVARRAETSSNSPSTKQSASIACPPAIVRVLAPFRRSPCQMRPSPRRVTAWLTTLMLAETISPM